MDEQAEPQDSQPASGQDPYRPPYNPGPQSNPGAQSNPGVQSNPGAESNPGAQSNPGRQDDPRQPGQGYPGQGFQGNSYPGGRYEPGYGSPYGPSQLRRRRYGRVVAGVAGGLADYLDLDPSLVRVGFVLLSVFGGIGLPVYLACWLLIPEEGADAAVADGLFDEIGDFFADAEARIGGRTR